MVFGFFRKRRPAEAPRDPLATYDALIEELKRQAAQVRKSAATLVALRADLERDLERYKAQAEALKRRRDEALRTNDAAAAATIERDLKELRDRVVASEQAWQSANEDGALLGAAAEALNQQLRALQVERGSARSRLEASRATTEALRAQAERVGRLLQLDAARDEVERAHALAEIYREDKRTK